MDLSRLLNVISLAKTLSPAVSRNGPKAKKASFPTNLKTNHQNKNLRFGTGVDALAGQRPAQNVSITTWEGHRYDGYFNATAVKRQIRCSPAGQR
jgi:hypothetical protein